MTPQAQPDLFTPEARDLWAKVPNAVKPKLLATVWCTHCKEKTTPVDFGGEVVAGDLVLSGFCSRCRGKAARLIEFDEP